MDLYASEASVQALTSNPILDKMYRGGSAAVKSGGARIDIPVRYGMNPGYQWYQGTDKLDMAPYETNTSARYDWKQLHAPVTYTGEESRKNRGDSAMLDLVTERIGSTQLTLRKVLDAAMAGNGLANDGKVILGLEAMFPTTPTSDPTIGAIGGIGVSGNAWWQNYAVTSFGSFATYGPKGTSNDKWLNAFNTISDGSDQPDLIISSQDVTEFYNKAALTATQIIMSQNATGQLSFPTLKYQGTDWFWSRNIPDGRAYFLRSSDLKFWLQSGASFTLSPFVKAFDQDLYGASMLVMGAFFTDRRLFSAVLDGILV
jgi:hypothetical protein